jgi:hypothetical protein
MTGMGSMSFYMPSCDVVELDGVLYVLGLTMSALRCVARFNNQQLIIKCCSHDLDQFLAKDMREGDFYRLLADPIKYGALMHDSDQLCELLHKIFGHLHYALPLLKDMFQHFQTSR